MLRNIRSDFDYTNKDFTAFKQMMINALRQKLPEYTDTSDSDAGIVILEACAMGLDILSYYNDVAANEAFFSTLKQRTNALKWCRIFGYTPRSTTPAKFKQVFYLKQVLAYDYLIPIGTVIKAVQDGEEVLFETLEDHTIPAGKFGNEQTVPGTYDYTVDIAQGVSVIQEIIGSSTGAPNQVFTLNYYPVISNSIVVFVGDNVDPVRWTYVTSFMDSTPADNHFSIQYTGDGEAQVVFGDGVFGSIPQIGINNIICSYRSGGGEIGNVGANRITQLIQPVPLLQTFNPGLAYELGAEAETLDSIKMKAPNSLRTLKGALSLTDFGDVIVLNFPEVSDALCVQDATEDDLIIYVIMKQGYTLTEDFKSSFTEFFSESAGGRKIVGVNDITFLPPIQIGIDLTANLILDPFYSEATVKAQIQDYVQRYIDYAATSFTPRYFSLNQMVRDIMTVSTSGIEGIRSFSFQTATVHSGYTPSAEFSISPDMINLGAGEVVKLETLTITKI